MSRNSRSTDPNRISEVMVVSHVDMREIITTFYQ